MASGPPSYLGSNSPLGRGQRSLAAIVFTDIVSFSARMQTDEVSTLRLLDRDFAAMREICVQHEGSVLKTTGDGLLLYFSSAVQAVACALAMQRFFAEQAKGRVAAENLVHRIGIHLGDVFVNEQDVMGDGVNIAARLQAEAEPGGICISQTVYDVVKNKLALHVTKLGARELKNISQHIPMYKLLLEASAVNAGREEPPAEEPATRVARAPLSRGVKLAGGAALLLVVAAFAVFAVMGRREAKRELAQVEATQNAFAGMLADDPADPHSVGKSARTLAAWRTELREQRSRAVEEFNFAELAASLKDPRSPVAGKPEAQMRAAVLQRIQELFAWTATALQRYSREQPLTVRELSGTAPKEIRVYVGPDRRLYYAEGGAVRQRNWTELKPPVMAAIIAGAMLESQPLPPREVVQGAVAFAYFYHLPELPETLRAGRSGSAGSGR